MSLMVPQGWRMTSIGQVCHAHGGYGFPVRLQGRKSGEVPFFKVGDISAAWRSGHCRLERAQHYISNAEVSGLRARLVPRDAVVFAKIGEAIALNRRAVLLKPSLIDNNCMAVSAEPSILNSGYLFYFMQTVRFGDASRASVVPSLRRSDVLDVKLPLPPLPEQRRIVAKIEELFSDLDAGVAALKRVKANLKRYRAAVLKAAVEGRLTEEWRNRNRATEPAAKLLERILAERRAKWEQDQRRKFKEAGKTPPKGWREKYREPCAADTVRLAHTMHVPDGWSVASTEQVAEMSLGKMLDREKHQSGQLLPYLRNVNIRWGWVDMSDLKQMYFKADETNRFGLLPGDVLVCEGGEPGRAAVWIEADSKMTFQKAVHRVRCSSHLHGRYLVTLLEDYAKSGRLERFFTGSTIKHLTGESFATLPVPLPPFAEQAEIVAQVDYRLSVADAAETQVEHALQRAARLRQAILKRAFEGKLVPQDPSDEPATAVVERLQCDGADTEPAKHKSRSANDGYRSVTIAKGRGVNA